LSTHVTFGIQRGLKIPFCVKILTTQRDSIIFFASSDHATLGAQRSLPENFFSICIYNVLHL